MFPVAFRPRKEFIRRHDGERSYRVHDRRRNRERNRIVSTQQEMPDSCKMRCTPGEKEKVSTQQRKSSERKKHKRRAHDCDVLPHRRLDGLPGRRVETNRQEARLQSQPACQPRCIDRTSNAHPPTRSGPRILTFKRTSEYRPSGRRPRLESASRVLKHALAAVETWLLNNCVRANGGGL